MVEGVSEAASESANDWDVVTLGETMLRLTPKGFERFEQSNAVEMHVGGSESNSAVGLARLGHRVCWLSRLTDNPIGKLIASTIAAQGVDASHVVWTDRDRVGTYYLERGQPPRNSQVFYDRADSAMSRMTPENLPENMFAPKRSRYFHTTGITLGISPDAAKTATEAARLAREAGWKVSFDTNYRGRLWPPNEAAESCDRFIDMADLVFLPLRDAQQLYGVATSDARKALEELHRRWTSVTIVMTLGSQGAAAIDVDGRTFRQPAYSATEVERLGGGDAFSAGFLSGQLQNGDIASALRWGAAAAAIKYTIPGDLPLFDRSTVQSLASSGARAAESIAR